MSAYPRHLTLSPQEKATIEPPKEIVVPVEYPDGTTGECHYQQLGPQCHRLSYRYGDGSLLARIPIYTDVPTVSIAAKENAEKAFAQAILSERQEVFARATFPAGGGRDVDRNKATLTPDKAKELGGKYAVCLRLPSGKLLAVSRAYDTIEEANARYCADPSHVVACASRLDRRWMVPKYNPLHATRDFRREAQSG
jgi:hypothetical protein